MTVPVVVSQDGDVVAVAGPGVTFGICRPDDQVRVEMYSLGSPEGGTWMAQYASRKRAMAVLAELTIWIVDGGHPRGTKHDGTVFRFPPDREEA